MIDLRDNNSTVAAPDLIPVSAAAIASPTAAMLANVNSIYVLNVSPYTAYKSDGSSLNTLGSGSSGTYTPPAVVTVGNAAARKLGSTYTGLGVAPTVGMLVAQTDQLDASSNPTILWRLNSTADITADSNWSGFALTDPTGQLIADLRLADFTGVVAPSASIGYAPVTIDGGTYNELRVGDGITSGGINPLLSSAAVTITATNAASVTAALNLLAGLPPPAAGMHLVKLPAGALNLGTISWPSSPNMRYVQLQGNSKLALTGLKVKAVSGSSGNWTYKFSCTATQAGFMAVGDVIVKDGNPYIANNDPLICGAFKITAINVAGTSSDFSVQANGVTTDQPAVVANTHQFQLLKSGITGSTIFVPTGAFVNIADIWWDSSSSIGMHNPSPTITLSGHHGFIQSGIQFNGGQAPNTIFNFNVIGANGGDGSGGGLIQCLTADAKISGKSLYLSTSNISLDGNVSFLVASDCVISGCDSGGADPSVIGCPFNSGTGFTAIFPDFTTGLCVRNNSGEGVTDAYAGGVGYKIVCTIDNVVGNGVGGLQNWTPSTKNAISTTGALIVRP